MCRNPFATGDASFVAEAVRQTLVELSTPGYWGRMAARIEPTLTGQQIENIETNKQEKPPA